ncbi:hypothetical protein FB451DRAFT_1567335 [Mycena latifolia]|nr:hypothetical protein FB451DRAFT_1567335 [Mycena latifolia]
MGGALAPRLTTFGSDLGVNEVKLEPLTTDGRVLDPLTMAVSDILGDTVFRAVDGLQFVANILIAISAYHAGVAAAVITPMGPGFLQGIGTAFSTGAPNALADGTILRSSAALQISIHSQMRASVNTQIAAPPNMLFHSSAAGPWSRVKAGKIPLVTKVHNADIIATLLLLKAEFETPNSATLRMTFAGATEAHLLATQIGAAGASVILAPRAPVPRIPPHTAAVTTLLQHDATLVLGVQSEYAARTVIYARFELACAALDADGAIGDRHGQGARTRLCRRLANYQGGGCFDLESKVLGVVSGRRAVMDLFSIMIIR